jgi:excisionase family DNA binding protein
MRGCTRTCGGRSGAGIRRGVGSGSGVAERLLSARELGDLLGFAAGTIVDWAEAGRIPAFKVGGRLRFRLSEVEAWLEGRRVVALERAEA